MNKNIKNIFLVVTLLFLLVGVTAISASDVSDDTIVLEDTADIVAAQTTTSDNIIETSTAKNIKTEEQTTDLYVSDTNGSDDNNGTNTSPYKTVQKALDQTNSDSTFNIHIAEGIYKGLGNTNLTVNGNYNINFIGEGINKTILDGQARWNITTSPGYVWGSSEIWWPYVNQSGDYAMTITQGDGLISIKNLNIDNMYCIGGNSIEAYQHAPVDNYGNLKVDNVSFYNNHAGTGSAIRNNAGSTLIVNNSYFLNNSKSSSTGNNGAGIYNNATAEVYNSLFDGNHARWSTILSDKNLIVVNCTFKNGIAYDGSSTYRYGTGIGANSGAADYYAQGFFMTNTQVLNCTFINNQECDIYVFEGNLIASGNKFINSTGIYVNDNEKNVSFNYTIDNNIFENMIPSSITQSLSSGNTTFAIEAPVINSSIIISNNKFTTENATVIRINGGRIVNNIINLTGTGISIALVGNNTLVENNNICNIITIEGDNNNIHNNNITTTSEYTIYLTGRTMRNNSITNNELKSYSFLGDLSVNGTVNNIGRSIIANNTPTTPDDYIYVSFDITQPADGTINNPTTILDALAKIENNQTICLIPTKSQSLSDIDTININPDTINENTKTFKITSLTDNFIFNRNNNQKQERIFNISEGYSITLNNIIFKNIERTDSTNGGAIYTESDLNIENCQFINITATRGGAIYANKQSNIKIVNSTFKDVKASDETIYLNNTGIKTLENNTYINSSIETTTLINSDALNKKNHINETITINIENTTITNPEFYDTTLLNNLTYNIYINDKLADSTSENTFTIIPKTTETINIYVKPEFSHNPSNSLTFPISYDEKINIQLYTENVFTFNDTDSYIETILTDEFGATVKSGKVSYYNGQTLINNIDVENGKAVCQLPALTVGLHEIKITYEDTEETYNPNNNTVQITILDKIYVNPTLTTPDIGTYTNPTTITDALKRISDTHIIFIVNQDNQTYYLNDTIRINPETVHEGVTSFIIEGENITLDGQKNIQIMNITQEYDITLKNMTFQNAKSNPSSSEYDSVHGGAIRSDGNITLEYTNFYNNRADESNGGAICSQNLKILGNNIFINNTARCGGAISGKNITITGENEFINNTAYSPRTLVNGGHGQTIDTMGGAVYGANTTIEGNNKFINNSARDYGGAIFSFNTYIFGNNLLINNSAKYYGGSISTFDYMFINNTTFIESSAEIGGVILAAHSPNSDMNGIAPWGRISRNFNNAERVITNNNFINCSSDNEIFESTKSITLENNSYLNCSIQLNNNTISLNPETITPVMLNGEVIIDITNVTLVHPTYYDENILDNLTYNVYINNDIKTSTKTNNATIVIDTVGDNNIYVTPTFSQIKSNIIYYDIEKDGLKNTVITATDVVITFNNTADITVTVKDKDGEIISGEGVITIYNQNNEIIGTKTLTAGTATVTTTPFTQIGENMIIVTYNTTENYNNQTNTSTVIVKLSDVYVSPIVTTPQTGTRDDPTTINDALTKVAQNGTIHLLKDHTDIYILEETININSDNVKKVNGFKIQAETDNIIFDGVYTTRILDISPDYSIEIVNISFQHGNTTAIYNQGNLTINGKSTFENNQGRAINNTGNLIINGSHTFFNNYQTYGGAIHSKGNLTINGSNIFIENQAYSRSLVSYGGAIYVYSDSNVIINGTNTFKNNKVTASNIAQGGAIYLERNSKLIINGTNTFEENEIVFGATRIQGGAIYSAKGENIIEGKNLFKSNTAGEGGAIFSTGQLSITGENIFSDNQATNSGGTIYVSGNLTISGNTIINSTATQGGAIYAKGAATIPIIIINGTTFDNTQATNGGAIYTASNKLSIQISNNIFNNIAATTETIELTTENILLNLENNTYNNCSILNTFTLTSPQEEQTIPTKEPITLNTELTLTNPQYYDADILDNLEYQIYINDENTYNTTESESTFTPEEYGTYTIHAYNQQINTQSNNISINTIKKEITIEPTIVKIGDKINITAIIKINNETMTDLSKGKITFKINGKTLKDTNGKVIYAKVVNGTATIEDYLVPDDWAKKGTTIQAVYSGSTDCEKLTSEKTEITITKEEPTLTTSNITATAGSSITLTATITDNNKVINNGKVVFKINGKTVKDASGKVIYAKVVNNQVSVEYTLPADMKAKDYNITATFISSDYDKLETTNTMTILKS